MKLLFSALFVLLSLSVFSQEFYNSKNVNNGQSYQFSVPSKFELIPMGDDEFAMYVEDLDAAMEGDFSDCLIFGILTNDDGLPIDELMDEVQIDILSDVENAKTDSYKTPSGKLFYTVSGNLLFLKDEPTPVLLAFSTFKDVIVVTGIMGMEPTREVDPSTFYSVLNSYKEYSTDRENAFFPEEEFEDNDFLNNQFETSLSYDYIDFLPEYPNEDTPASEKIIWIEDWNQEYPELLLAYIYVYDAQEQEELCGIKIFSGGSAEGYTGTNEQLLALKKVLPSHYIDGITPKESFAGDDFNFQQYEVQSSGFEYEGQVLYTTEIRGEIVFLLGYFNGEPTPELSEEMETLVKTLFYEVY